MRVMQVKDVCRSIDFLQSRPDIAGDKIGYLGVSWGAMDGPMPLAVEKRIRAAVLWGAGGVSGWAYRVTIPVQMDSGRFDYQPVETPRYRSSKPSPRRPRTSGT